MIYIYLCARSRFESVSLKHTCAYHFRFLSFHPPTPSNIIASKWNLSLETSLSFPLLLEFLFPKISSSSRKARQNKLDEERKKRGEGIGNGEETGVYNWLVLAHPPPPSSTLDSWESRPPQASSSFCAASSSSFGNVFSPFHSSTLLTFFDRSI